MSNTAPPIRLELVAALLVPSATLGFIRVFADANAALPLVGAALLSTALAVGARRARVPLILAALISVAGLVVLVSSRYAPGTNRLGVIPTRETAESLRLLFDDGLVQFRELRAPVESLDPFIAAAMVATWVMSFLTDWGANRLRLSFEPVLPAALLFIFSSVLGSGSRQLVATFVFAAAVLAWAVVQRASNLAQHRVWLTADRSRGPLEIARNSLAIGIIAVAAGLALGPQLPSAEAEGLYSWRNRGDPVRVVVSPFVSIQSRLAEQQTTLLFTVRSDRPAYWRLAGLDTFENGFWSTRGKFQEERGDLPGLTPTAGTTVTVRSEFTIEALDAIWLPAAFAPSKVVDSADPVTWNADTGSLTIDNSRPTSDGVTYTVESVVPLYTPDELRAATPAVPTAIAERYLSLPDDLTPRIAAEAATITAGADTNYDKMIAIQEHFRTYDYSLRLDPLEDGQDPIDAFFDDRIGFCQQFSSAMALMARQLGVPARVAVGFTWGDPVDGEEGLYNITGRQTHAWPEIWFGGLGWVAFEPTPGRGAPDATHNPVDAQQDSLVQPDQPGRETTTTSTRDGVNRLPEGEELDFDPALGLGDEEGTATRGGSSGLSIPIRWLFVLLLIGGYVFGMPAWHRLRRARRAQQAETEAQRIEAAWANAAEAIESATGLTRPPASTRGEWASKLASDMRVPADPIMSLGSATTRARFGADTITDNDARAAEEAATEIRSVLRERSSWWRNWLADLDPRRILKPTGRTIASA